MSSTMQKTALALAMILAVGLTAGLAQEAKPEKTESVTYANIPSMKAHKELEKHRVELAKFVSRHTVSVEIDYDRDAVATPSSNPLGRFMGGPDMNDPFYRYDFGPFSGLVVGPNHILVSDRCLGDFEKDGPSEAVEAITVTLPNGQRWPGRVVGRHQQIDLALLELDCVINETCPQLEVYTVPAERVKLKRGESILVVGRGQNPLGTLVNDGIVSALDRENGRAFQLDARIGNSTLGAPVVNMDGTLVGMVTLHNHPQFGQASGVSYAAYIDGVREAYDLMKTGGFVERPPTPFMGVGASEKWTDKPGLEINNVLTGSGAERAGIRLNDIIVSVDGREMYEVGDLIQIISEHKIGDTLKVKLLRGEQEMTIEVTLGPRQ